MSDDDTGDEGREKGGASPCLAPHDSSCILGRHPIDSPKLDTILDALSSYRRRRILYHLINSTEDVAELSELVAVVRQAEKEEQAAGVPPPKGRVRLDLHHKQLPKLRDAGFIDFDERQGTVRYLPAAEITEWVTHARFQESTH